MSLSPPHHSHVSAFEQASNDVQCATTRAAAEQTLAGLTARPDSIGLAFAVLQSTNSPLARFHAAATLRTAIRDKWHALSPQHRYGPASFRHSLISTVISKPELLSFERVAVLRTVAFLTRQAYIEEKPALRDDYFSLICESASSPQSPPHTARTAVELMDLILDEFTTPSLPSCHLTSSIDRELFVRSRLAFASPTGHIISMFQAALFLLRGLTASIPLQNYSCSTFSNRAIPALSVILRILTTDFPNAPIPKRTDHASTSDPPSNTAAADTLETVIINTFNRPEWRVLVDQISHVSGVCFQIIAALIAAPLPCQDSDLLANPLHIVTAVAAISHLSYSSPESASDILAALMRGLNEQNWSASSIGSVRLAYAEVWRRVSCAHGLTQLECLHPNYIIIFAGNTCQQMDAAALKIAHLNIDEDIFSMDVVDLLLETWANLALQSDDGAEHTEHPHYASIEKVVLHFIRMSLRTTGNVAAAIAASGAGASEDINEDLGFDDVSMEESRLAVVSILTRFVLGKIVDALVQSLRQAADKVFNWPHGRRAVNGFPLDMYQEDLFFLIELTYAVLTDEAKGEYPSVPKQFISRPSRETVPNRHPKPSSYAQRLITAVFQVAEMETQLLNERGAHCSEASPRVASSLLNGLARIVATYLAPLNSGNAALAFEAAGGQVVMEVGRACCFSKAMEGITKRGFDGDVAESASHLLCTLATASKHYLILRESSAWQSLMHSGVEAIQTLPPKAVQDIGKSLASVLGDVVSERLVVPAYNCLQALASGSERIADAPERAIATVNMLQGVARSDAVGVRTRQALLECVRTPGGVAAFCAKTFGSTRLDVSRALLKLADDIVYCSLPLLPENDGRELLSNVLALLKMHVEMIASYGNDLPQNDIAGHVEDLLLILTHILEDDMNIDVGDACFFGLSALFPLMNECMLDIPSVHRTFFQFVSQLVSRHAEKVSLLPVEFGTKILQSLDVQRGSYDAGSERKALEAITALARTRAMAQLQIHDDIRQDGVAIVNSALRQFLISIFNAIANGCAHTSNLDAAADALLPLVHVYHEDRNGSAISAFEQVGHALVLSSGNSSDLRDAIAELGRVATEAGAAYGLHRSDGADVATSRLAEIQASKRFREAVAKFSYETRNCLVTAAIGATTTTS